MLQNVSSSTKFQVSYLPKMSATIIKGQVSKSITYNFRALPLPWQNLKMNPIKHWLFQSCARRSLFWG